MTQDEIRDVQRALRMLGHYDGAIDGVVGAMTMRGLWTFSKVKYNGYPDIEALAAETFAGKHVIELRSIPMAHYTGKPVDAWFAADVVDSMRAAIMDWQERCPGLRITESIRPLDVQRRVHGTKPGLAAIGWSLHGHGRAADFDFFNTVPRKRRLEFYETFAAHGWCNIHSAPGSVVLLDDEQWHLQRTDPPGINAKTHLTAWANEVRGNQSIQEALESLVYIKL